MIGQHGGRRCDGLRHGRGFLACTAVAMASWTLAAAAAAESAPRPRTARTAVVDSAVVPAGGVCHGCREGHCRTCRPGGHHAGCRDGKCHPSCPVRPQEFGFYGTQWRRWPGQGIVPAANEQDATPARPPKSAVPRAEEESPRQRADELPAPQPDTKAAAPREPAAEPAMPRADPVPPVPVPAEPAPLPIEAPAAEPAAPAPPPAAPPAKQPAADDNLFDESATGPVPRRFVASRPAKAAAERPARPAVRPATLTYPASVESLPKSVPGDSLAVPRVPFDPAAEAARLGR
mgnify:CR=1 FL=1